MVDTKKEQERDELHKAIWSIADDLRGSVDGWDFKSYVLSTMFYRFISENLTNYINDGEIEIVRPVDNSKFCANCSRLRITPDGKIKPCLLRNDNLVELISHIRNGEREEKLEEIFIRGIDKREPFNK